MSSSERVLRVLRRVDIRLALTLGAIFAPLVAIVLFVLYSFAASELLELAEMEVDERLNQLEIALEEPDAIRRSARLGVLTDQLAVDSGGFIVRDATGQSIAAGGRALSSDARTKHGLALTAAAITSADGLRTGRQLASGDFIEVEIGSQHFVRERDEILHGFWVSLAFGIVLVAAASIPATWLAFAPLRRATRMAERIDLTRLDARLPSRETNDDIDRHADAVNCLLERIETGFERIQHFSDDVAHELRTPVNRILNEIEVALLDVRRSDRDRPELESIRDAAGGMARLIDGLLMLARSEGDGLSVAFARVDMGDLFRMLEEMYEPVCEEQGLKLEVGPVAGAVRGDTALLLRAVGNLIDNAIAYTPRGGTIRWRVDEEAASKVRIEIADTGPGIPAVQRDRVFERFVRLDAIRPAGSVGLGLAITRMLVQLHAGDVSLEEPPGRGACFVIRLPCAEPV